jgi:hypothetical protein
MAVIDFGKAQNAAAFLKKTLKNAGLSADFGQAIAAMGRLVRDHRHLERLLTEAGPEIRQELYDALRPNLRFSAHPLDWYVAQAQQRAEREQLPTLDAEGALHPFKPARDVSSAVKEAQDAIAKALAERTLTLTCGKCTRKGVFYAVGKETNVDVILKARKEGWVYDYKHEPPREICPDCPTALRTAPNA